MRMHEGQVVLVDAAVHRAVAEEFPAGETLRLTRLPGSGTMNAVFRLGAEYVVRVPIIDWGADDAQHEATVLPRVRGALPLETPELLAVGQARPDLGIPWAWTLTRWVPGMPARGGTLPDAAVDAFAGLLHALHDLQVDGAPPSPARADALSQTDRIARALEAAALPDTAGILRKFRKAVRAGAAAGGARGWIHGDPTPGNLLVQDGRLSGMIDWSAAGVGSREHDLLSAWWLFDARGRSRLRDALDAAPEEWNAARLLAWRKAALAVGYYARSNPGFAADARFAITQLVADDPAGR